MLKNPEKILGELCDYLEIDFPNEQMLHWPAGKRASDGVWAHHWYDNVEQSTGFGEYRERTPKLSGNHLLLAEEMQPYYDELARLRILP